ncbi:MAG TPA: bifunctional phosphoribosylaminoimidazolecarboxamide formyltransferase/IMP cyclohydrolase [Acidimicrobiales bacterium]|nr:MAG: bifunctional phosphoribosylaminoimidazolecarboxamide formyltransferase/IMP cyclohydrolase [Actinobacteria bacterium 21-73-9]HQU26945.1 bifunctional phosphoribosylaminoimidazolecarboxamide formyltransferase/IMP cyclohydrolase [Acidimicrobiales bacterium]
MRALLSVYDKTGLVELARGLHELGWELVASGQTAATLAGAGLAPLEVVELTGFPEMLDGRVKTLHPRVHAAILADLERPEHRAQLEAHSITPIDLVVVNLYPFAANPSIELIDVGGPTMVRAAAKNHARVSVLTDPGQYEAVLAELRAKGATSPDTRRRLARAAFATTAAYDARIAAWLADDEALPERLVLDLERVAATRYGENPHQLAARYRRAGTRPWWDGVTQHAGSALSYLNYLDADAAWRLVHELAADVPGTRAAAIIKHANASGAAVAETLRDAFERALAADPQSAFGGVVAIGGEVDDDLAHAIAAGPQADVIVAAGFTPGAIEALVARRKATRLLEAPAPEPLGLSVRTIGDTALVQDADELVAAAPTWTCATTAAPTASQMVDLVVAWRVCARTTSNAVVIASGGVAVGVGAGQQSRVVAAELAVAKAGERARGGAAASDAFFPFPDGLERLAEAGVTAVVQPGGSVRDGEVVAAADAAGLVMMMTGERHFRH